MRWIRLDTLRFWFVESWGQALAESPGSAPSAGARDEEALSVPFKTFAQIRAKLQHDPEVRACVASACLVPRGR
jgi:hypothetical protein